MAGATNTTLGTIKLAGDFIGSHAEAPSLRPSGVKAGTYNITDKVYVDAQGRITWAKQLPEDFPWPEGSKTTDGVVQIGVLPEGNRSIDVDANSVISINKATTSDAGVAKLGNGLAKNVGSGATDIVVPDASTTVFGYARPDNSSMQVNIDGVISVDGTWVMDQEGPATTTTTGGVKVGEYFAIDGAGDLSVAVPDASTSVKGLMQIGTGFTYEGSTISVPHATSTVKGIFKPKSTNLFIDTDFNRLYLNNCASPYFENPEGKIGLVAGVSGPYMSIDWPTSTISCSYNFDNFVVEASTSDRGKAQIGDNIDVSSGVISLPDPTGTIYGPVKVTGRSFKVSGDGALFWDTHYYANATYGGHVRPDGVTIKFSDEPNAVISFDPADTPVATTTSKGIVQVGSGFNVSSGVLSVPHATDTVTGIVSAGSGIVLNNGVISLDEVDNMATSGTRGVMSVDSVLVNGEYVDSTTAGLVITDGTLDLRIATANKVGGIKTGDAGFSINSGVLSYSPVLASESVYGAFKPDNTTTSVYDTVINGVTTPVFRTTGTLATNSSYGIVKPGDYFAQGSHPTMTPGVLDLRNATTGLKGIITIQNNDEGLTLIDGVLNLANASTIRKGIMKVGYGLSNNWDSVVSTNYKSINKNVKNKFAMSQMFKPYTETGLPNTISSSSINNSTYIIIDPVDQLVDNHTITVYSDVDTYSITDSRLRIFYKVRNKMGTSTPIELAITNSSGTSTSGFVGAGLSEGTIVMFDFIKMPALGVHSEDVVFDKYTVFN